MESINQQIHKFEESVFECQFCKKEFMYLFFDWYYNSKKQLECVECHGESVGFDEFISKDCYVSRLPTCPECDEVQTPEPENDKQCGYDYCDYCQEFLGVVIGYDDGISQCRTCSTDYDKDCKLKTVCPTCRNHLN